MGFAIVGENHFLASGHPNGARDLPPHLGLIESTDAGRTWESVSRIGKSDFHVLRSGDRRTYGWSTTSGRLEVTTDRSRWSDRGEMALVDLAVDPQDDRNLLAAVATSDTEVVVRESHDGGKNWIDLDAPESLVRLDWPSDGQAWGVASNGLVYTRDGDDWTRQGRLAAAAEAITSDRDSWYAAADEAIHRSDDGGETWEIVVEYDD